METTTTTTVANNTGPPQWTDERHLHFLKSMEASFVHTMLENYNGRHRQLRLDRQLPDTSDSTLDLKKRRTINKHVNPAADIIIGSRRRNSNIDSKADKRPRRHSSSYRPYTSSQDQVVPLMENRRDDKDESGSTNVHVGLNIGAHHLVVEMIVHLPSTPSSRRFESHHTHFISMCG
ncbi:hypothetical protein Ddye_013670 [Dipteronia dyeriana]|uniref:Uncharacterized protein n=1 Tax=Dipteronia dyeriana TaxID=168575 RepID=A0AAE0CJV6_9ROSI|nr:hypothetical protein Ddye_013670 [Dipteronia dyeriana]